MKFTIGTTTYETGAIETPDEGGLMLNVTETIDVGGEPFSKSYRVNIPTNSTIESFLDYLKTLVV